MTGVAKEDTNTESRHPEDSSERDPVHQVQGAVSQDANKLPVQLD